MWSPIRMLRVIVVHSAIFILWRTLILYSFDLVYDCRRWFSIRMIRLIRVFNWSSAKATPCLTICKSFCPVLLAPRFSPAAPKYRRQSSWLRGCQRATWRRSCWSCRMRIWSCYSFGSWQLMSRLQLVQSIFSMPASAFFDNRLWELPLLAKKNLISHRRHQRAPFA